jgi:hypothetical protein
VRFPAPLQEEAGSCPSIRPLRIVLVRGERMTLVAGERLGAFIVLRDEDGGRHAIRLGAVLAVSDADCDQGSTVLQLAGNRNVLILAPMDEVLRWLT